MLTGNVKVECHRSTTGGKGNWGKFFDRNTNICAAGIPTGQADLTLPSTMECWLPQNEADALIQDTVNKPPKFVAPLPPLRKPLKRDQRNAGLFSELVSVVTPPMKTKFQSLVEDLKTTSYKSYWKLPLGEVPDPVPMFPEGFDIANTTYGKYVPRSPSLYDVAMPKHPLPDKTPRSKEAGVQKDRGYCRPSFNPDLTYGSRAKVDQRGIYMKCSLTDNKVQEGTSDHSLLNVIQAERKSRFQPAIGRSVTPNNNVDNVPAGHTFGKSFPETNFVEHLMSSPYNQKRALFLECMAHLNGVRKYLSKRFLPTFFDDTARRLKYFDTEKSGWLPKACVYKYFQEQLIRLNPELLEPLLTIMNAFDGSSILYKSLIDALNFTQHLQDLPKIPDVRPDFLDYSTTYREMVGPDNEVDERRMAGLPSGRYFDKDHPVAPEGYIKAHLICLMDESDVKACLNPTTLTLMHVSHRDMYATREPAVVRRVFEAAGEEFTDESFNKVWEEAKKYHSKGIVCYETFRRALEKRKPSEKSPET